MNDTIFVLEDMEARMPVFRNIAMDTGMALVHAETAEYAKEIFLEVNPKVVFLDHDLGGRIFVNSKDPETGYTFAKWMAKNDPDYKKRTIIIHSANPGGSKNIQAALNGHATILAISHFARRQNDLYYRYGLLTKKEDNTP